MCFIGELKLAVENCTDLKFGLYHSLYEWYNPLYLADKTNNFSNLDQVNYVSSKLIPELVDLVRSLIVTK